MTRVEPFTTKVGSKRAPYITDSSSVPITENKRFEDGVFHVVKSPYQPYDTDFLAETERVMSLNPGEASFVISPELIKPLTPSRDGLPFIYSVNALQTAQRGIIALGDKDKFEIKVDDNEATQSKQRLERVKEHEESILCDKYSLSGKTSEGEQNNKIDKKWNFMGLDIIGKTVKFSGFVDYHRDPMKPYVWGGETYSQSLDSRGRVQQPGDENVQPFKKRGIHFDQKKPIEKRFRGPAIIYNPVFGSNSKTAEAYVGKYAKYWSSNLADTLRNKFGFKPFVGAALTCYALCRETDRVTTFIFLWENFTGQLYFTTGDPDYRKFYRCGYYEQYDTKGAKKDWLSEVLHRSDFTKYPPDIDRYENATALYNAVSGVFHVYLRPVLPIEDKHWYGTL